MVIPTTETITAVFTNTANLAQQAGLTICTVIFVYNMCTREWRNSEHKAKKESGHVPKGEQR